MTDTSGPPIKLSLVEQLRAEKAELQGRDDVNHVWLAGLNDGIEKAIALIIKHEAESIKASYIEGFEYGQQNGSMSGEEAWEFFSPMGDDLNRKDTGAAIPCGILSREEDGKQTHPAPASIDETDWRIIEEDGKQYVKVALDVMVEYRRKMERRRGYSSTSSANSSFHPKNGKCLNQNPVPEQKDPRENCPWKCRVGDVKCLCANPSGVSGDMPHLVIERQGINDSELGRFERANGGEWVQTEAPANPSGYSSPILRAAQIMAVRDTLICIEKEDFSHIQKAETLISAFESVGKKPEHQREMRVLNPCPFCNAQGKLFLEHIGYIVECTSCDAVMQGPWDKKEDAISAWNRRTPEPVSLAQCAEAVKKAQWDLMSDETAEEIAAAVLVTAGVNYV